jgi:2-polyprenyl-3-methyl-5-hydroxy-6-metoxy-1,4-benzoquinol methylase
MKDESGRQDHWAQAYTAKPSTELSWFQARPDLSLELIEKTTASLDAAIIDVGGGASTLVDHLLDAGRTSLSVLDIAEQPLALAKSRLCERGNKVRLIVADITKWVPADQSYDIWHDRAVLHFLTDPADQAIYAATLNSVVRKEGSAIIGGFAKGSPTRCSGLEIVQHDAASLQQLLGDDFGLEEVRSESHRTPPGGEQLFAYHVFHKRS